MSDYDYLKLEKQLCFPLYAVSRQVVKEYYPHLKEIDLTYTQYIVLLVLWEHNDISVRDLGNKLFLDSGTLTPLIKGLEKKGLVTKHRSKTDERMVIISITEEGIALREKATDIPAKMAGCVGLEPDEAVQLYKLLYKMLDKYE